jgi:protein CpxP
MRKIWLTPLFHSFHCLKPQEESQVETAPTRTARRGFFKLAGAAALLAGTAGTAYAHRRDGFAAGPLDPEHLERMLRHLYAEIDATEAQKQKLAPIVQDAARDLGPLREQARAARRRGMELLSAPSVDRNALEALRVEQIQTADAASRRLTKALADAAEVLTPAQRKTVAARFARRRGARHRS